LQHFGELKLKDLLLQHFCKTAGSAFATIL